jgi:AAA domain (Cdc48 subfamily)
MTTTESNPVKPIADTSRREVNAYEWHEEEKAFRTFLDENMAGQGDVKDSLVEILAAIRNPLRDPLAPIFSVLMCGPSTSGKTLGFKLLVQWVHGARDKMMFFSGSEFEERHQVQKLIGAPPGYIGFTDIHDPKYRAPAPGEHDDSAGLAQHNLNNAKIGCKDDIIFILFDEWEKFHFAFNRFMLRPLREGTGELNNGQPVNFRNCVIGFTSNLGSEEIEKLATPFGFRRQESKVITKDDVRSVVVRELVKGYPPEFRNRINKVLFFAGLNDKELLRVVDLEMKTVTDRILGLGASAFVLSVDDNAKAWLLEKDGTSDEKSPLPGMQQKMNQHLVGPLGRLLRIKVIHSGDHVEVTHNEGADKLTFYITANPLGHFVPTVTDEPQVAPAPEGPTDNVAVNTVGNGSSSRELAVVPSGKASDGKSDTDKTTGSGVEVRYPHEFQLVIHAKPEQLEMVSAAVRAAADKLKQTLIVSYTNRAVAPIMGTVEVMSTMEDMVELKSLFQGLRVIMVGGELA